MDEGTFDIFAGAPEEHGSWVESVEGFSQAQRRMGQIAAEKPGIYFLFNGDSLSVLTRVQTIRGPASRGRALGR